MVQQSSISEICGVLRSARTALVVAHYHPDADAYGSSCGLALALRALGITAVILNESGSISRYCFIPGVAEVVDAIPNGFEPDITIACDCGDARRIGDRLGPVVRTKHPLINLDHHISNDFFGDFNVVLPQASSTSEIVFDLLSELEKVVAKPLIDAQVAACLFSGLSADTGSFRYSSTTGRAFAIAEDLVQRGALPYRLAQAMFAEEEISAVKLQAEALSNLELLANEQLAVVVVDAAMMSRHRACREDTEALVERARDIRGVALSIFFREDEGFWKVSMRSKFPELDVAKIASQFGGGGHSQAAGFRWRGELSQLRASVIPALEGVLKARVR